MKGIPFTGKEDFAIDNRDVTFFPDREARDILREDFSVKIDPVQGSPCFNYPEVCPIENRLEEKDPFKFKWKARKDFRVFRVDRKFSGLGNEGRKKTCL